MAHDSPRYQPSPAGVSGLLERGRLLLERSNVLLVAHVRAVSFYSPVAAPWLTLGGRAADSPGPFAALFCVAVLSAVLGHDHRR